MPPLAPPGPPVSLRAIRWKHPRRSYPVLLELALSRLNAAIDNPRGVLFAALFGGAPIAGGKTRERRKRIDGATNVVGVLSTSLASADIRRGLIATPLGDGWERKKWTDIDALAFGPLVPGQRGLRRTERAAAELIKQGYLRSIPWRVITPEGVRAIPGLKFVTDKLWKILGLWDAVRAERRRRQQREGADKKAEREGQIGAVVKQMPGTVPRSQGTAAPARPHPPAASETGPPPDQPAGQVAAESIATLKKRFGLE